VGQNGAERIRTNKAKKRGGRMAAINDLLRPNYRRTTPGELTQEFDRLEQKQEIRAGFRRAYPRMYPTVWRTHSPWHNRRIKKTGVVNDIYTVLKVSKDQALCLRKETGETFEIGPFEVGGYWPSSERPSFPHLRRLTRWRMRRATAFGTR